jgi:signal transduction histidine kinase
VPELDDFLPIDGPLMTALWLNSRSERLVAAHLADTRPAWLWAADGEKCLWRNHAAHAYEAAHRRQPGDVLVPVARQVPRVLRLGTTYNASRSHLQFTLGRKPISESCLCTPLLLGGNAPALLVVMTEAVSDAALADVAYDRNSVLPFAGDAIHYVLTGDDGQVLVSGGEGAARLSASQDPDTVYPAGNAASRLMLFPDEEPPATADAPPEAAAETIDTAPGPDEEPDASLPPANEDPEGVGELVSALTADRTAEDDTAAPEGEAIAAADRPSEAGETEDRTEAESDNRDLVDLFDRLANRKILFEPLGERDDDLLSAPMPAETEAATEKEAVPVRLWRVTGRSLQARQESLEATSLSSEAAGPAEADPEGNERLEPDDSAASEPEKPELSDATLRWDEPVEASGVETPEEPAEPAPVDKDVIERTSRYNFDELSRILTDRVSAEGDGQRRRPEPEPPTSSLVNLGDETLILNRLPLGLLVFREQEILFSNRALSDLLGYVDGSKLRKAGLAGVFPPDGDQAGAGPVTKLLGADGRLLNVSARLQTIAWQGRPALLLSASRQKEPLNAEDVARSFAEIMANALDCGYFETSRAGIITSVSGRAATLINRSPDSLIGRPIHGLIALNQGARLRGFLEQPARFAGVERPMIQFAGAEPSTEVILFAEGMAGIVTGYFGLLRSIDSEPAEETPARGIDPHFLVRLSRAIRQPVNAIIGFAEMIRTQAFGPVGNDRYVDYARFIGSGGQDIAGVVDELENYARLSEGNYSVTTARIDLIDLLEHCVARVRAYAGTSRVLVRSAISTSLPGISADRETMMQAVLNILASAIAHTPSGGQIVLSAQKRPDGAVEIHVRDSGSVDNIDMDEGFVVFRDGRSIDGELLSPIPSAIGLALTRALLSVNSCSLEVDPAPGNGTLLSLVIPAELVERADSAQR